MPEIEHISYLLQIHRLVQLYPIGSISTWHLSSCRITDNSFVFRSRHASDARYSGTNHRGFYLGEGEVMDDRKNSVLLVDHYS
jgi:hypothetical protein